MRNSSIRMVRSFCLGVVLTGFVGSACADSLPSGAPPLIQRLVKKEGYEVIKVMPSKVPDVNLYVLKKGVRTVVLPGYDQYVILGRFLSGDGRDVLGEEVSRLSKPVDVTGYAELLKKYKVIWIGGLRPELIVLIDPFSPEAMNLVLQADRVAKQTGARIGFLLVPGASHHSFGVAAKILRSKDPWSALREFAEKYRGNVNAFSAKVRQIPKATPEEARYFDSLRNLVMKEMGVDVVPVTLYKHSYSGKWGIVFGDHPLDYVLKMAAAKRFYGEEFDRHE